MKTNEIKQLLEAFYNGETSVEQEKQLFRYFESVDIAEDLQKEKELFLALYKGENIKTPPYLELKLNNIINDLANKDNKTPDEPINAGRHKWSAKIVIISAIACAACLLLVFLVTTNIGNGDMTVSNNNIVQENEKEGQLKDTFSNPEDAYNAAEDALMKVSTNLNKGLGQLSFAVSNIEKTNDKAPKSKGNNNNIKRYRRL